MEKIKNMYSFLRLNVNKPSMSGNGSEEREGERKDVYVKHSYPWSSFDAYRQPKEVKEITEKYGTSFN